MGAAAFFVRYFLVFILVIELLLLPFELVFLYRKSGRERTKSGEMIDFAELAVLFNIMLTIVIAIVVIITQAMML